jgi:nucleoside phosphorylase
MRILVTFAVETEFAPWQERHRFVSAQRSSNAKVYTTYFSGAEVSVGLTGIGPKAAADSICGFTWAADLDLCISSGFAGALRSEYQIGEVLAAREIVADASRSTVLGGRIASTKRLLGIAEGCGAKLVDRFYSSSSTVGSARDKKALASVADAVEMESFEVLGKAFAWMPEGVAIRAISDAADEDLPLNFDSVVGKDGDLSVARLAGQIVRKPFAIPGLIKLGKRSEEAARRLADFLDAYITALVAKPETFVSTGAL